MHRTRRNGLKWVSALAGLGVDTTIVAGQVRARSSFTSRPVTIDSPKLPPWITACNHRPY